MSPFYQSAFLKALGWSLIDSLWQMGLLWLLYILVTGNGKKLNSSFRYSVALMAVVSGCLWFVINIGFNYYHLSEGMQVFGVAYLLQNGLPEIDGQQWIPLLSSLYIAVVLVYAARWVVHFTGNKSIYNERMGSADSYYISFIDGLKSLSGVSRKITIWMSEKVTTPMTFGFLKPVILLPVSALSQLTTKQVEALIVHEFYHIKRNDYLVNIFTTLCELILFFNPFARLLLSHIRKERENCCDDEVIGLGYDRWEYAQALYILGKNDIGGYHFALAATGKGKQLLLQRVKRMLNKSHSSPSLTKPISIFFLCLFVAGTMSRDAKEVSPAMPAVAKKSNVTVFTTHDIVIEKDVPIVKSPDIVKQKTATVTTVIAPAPILPPPPPVSVNEPEDHENIIVASYVVSEKKTVEFCLMEAIVSGKVVMEQSVNCDASHPYIPGSTFYFPGHEISGVKDGKTTVQL